MRSIWKGLAGLALSLVAVVSLADTETVDGVVWTYVIKDGKASVGGGSSSQTAVPASTTGALTVPTMLGGCPVTGIGIAAFMRCRDLTSVTIPESVTSIGARAFSDCSSLKAVTIPEGVTSIGARAFYVSVLEKVVIPSSVTSIETAVFEGCAELSMVLIPEGVTSIGSYAFRHCMSLRSVAIPEGVTKIGQAAFFNCGLTDVMIPSSVTEIGLGAFFSCDAAMDISVADGNTSFCSSEGILYDKSMSTLIQCPMEKSGSVTIPGSVTAISEEAFSGCRKLTSVTIPEGVTSIGQSAFRFCGSLTTVTIPASVTSIGKTAFSGCDAAMAISVADGNTSFCSSEGILYDKSMFTLIQCPGGKNGSVTIPGSVTAIGEEAFYGCEMLTSVTIPEGVTNIAEWAFSYCSSLTSVTIPRGVTSIGDSAFYLCSGLTSVTIPASVKRIENEAFSWCRRLKTVYVEKGDEARVKGLIESSGYDISGLTFAEIADHDGTYTETVDGVVWTYVVKDGKASVGGGTSGQTAVPQSTTGVLTIPSILSGCPVTEIGYRAFENCSGLTSVVVPEGVLSISDCAFQYCASLASVSLPSTLENIGSSVFSYCQDLQDIRVASGNADYKIQNGCLLTADGTELIRAPVADTVDIPDGVLMIDEAFCGMNETFKCLRIPSSVEIVGLASFAECVGLTNVVIPASVSSIGLNVFSGDSALVSIEVDPANVQYASVDGALYTADKTELISAPHTMVEFAVLPTVTNIWERAFSGSRALASVVIPASVTSIGYLTFEGCASLTSAVFEGNAPILVSEGIYCGAPNAITYVQPGSTGWQTSGGLPEMWPVGDYWARPIHYTIKPDGTYTETVDGVEWTYVVKGGEASVGGGTEAQTAVAKTTTGALTIPAILGGCPVTGIGAAAFLYCSELTSVTIPAGVKTLGDGVFARCTSLTEIRLDGNTNFTIRAGLLCSQDGKTVLQCPGALSSVDIPDDVTCLADLSFDGCPHLHELVLPTSLESIGYGAIGGCPIVTLHVPANVSKIDAYQFAGCDSLTNFTVDASNRWFSSVNGLLCDKAGTMLVHCPRGVSEVTIPSTVTSIRGYALSYCYGMTTVTIPSTVTSIGASAFSQSWNLKTVYVEKGDGPRVKGLMEGSGFDTSATTFVELIVPQPDGTYTETVDGRTWTFFIRDGKATLGVPSTSQAAVSPEPDADDDIVIPSTLGGCPVAAIEHEAFFGLNFRSIRIPATVEDCGLFNLAYIDEYVVDAANPNYCSADGHLYNKDRSLLVKCSTSAEALLIPDGVVEVGVKACQGCRATNAVLSASVKILGLQAFCEAQRLTRITLPEGLVEIGDDAFWGCNSLDAVRIPASVSQIGDAAFSWCDSLVDLTVVPGNGRYCMVDGALYSKDMSELLRCSPLGIECIVPESVSRLGGSCFDPVDGGVKSVHFRGNAPAADSHFLFYYTPGDLTCYVREGSVGWVDMKSTALPELWPEDNGRKIMRWEGEPPLTHAVTFDLGEYGTRIGGGELEQTVVGGQAAVAPTVLSSGGMAFDSWDVDFSFVTEDLTVRALYANPDVFGDGTYSVVTNGYAWTFVIADGEATIVECGAAPVGHLDIPGLLGGCPVVALGESLFDNGVRPTPDFESVTIAASVVRIGDRAFYGCSALKYVTYAGDAALILFGTDVFTDTPYDQGFVCTETVDGIEWTFVIKHGEASVGGGRIGQMAVDQSTTGALTVPTVLGCCPVAEIGACAFYSCTNLTSVTIPSGVTSIGHNAFQGCENLTVVVIPEGLAKIETAAFEWCRKVGAIQIPSTVTNIEEGAFGWCSPLHYFVASGNPRYQVCNGLLCDKVDCVVLAAPWNDENGHVEVPEGITRIGDAAFAGLWGSLYSVVMHEGVKTIGEYAFFNCNSLEWVVVPASVESIDNEAFAACFGEMIVHYAGNAPTVPANIYDNSDEDGNVEGEVVSCVREGTSGWGEVPGEWCGRPIELWTAYPDVYGVEKSVEVDGRVWRYCPQPGGAEILGCDGATGDLAIPSELDGHEVTVIRGSAFGNCNGLTSVVIPTGVTTVGEAAFYGCSGLTDVEIPSSVASLGRGSFAGCDSLVFVYVEKGDGPRVKGLMEDSGFDTSAVTFLEIGAPKPDGTYTETVDGWTWTFFIREGKATLGGPDEDYDLYWKAAVSPRPEADDDIVIPATLGGCPVVAIGHEAFIGQSFRSIRIPATVTDCGLFDQAYIDEYVVDADNPNYCSADGHLYNKDRSVLVKCSTSAEALVVPDGVVEIGIGACMRSRATNVVLSASVKILGSRAFMWAFGLTRITLPEGLVEIGDYAFWQCDGLRAARIPASVTQIGNAAFSLCDSLVDLTVAPGNAHYCVVDGALYSKDMSELLRCSPLDVECIVPESVRRLGGSCFAPVYWEYQPQDTVLTSVRFKGNAPIDWYAPFDLAPDDLTCYAREGSVGWVDMKSTALPETWPEDNGRKIVRWEGEPPLTHAVTFDLGEYGTRIGGGELEQTVVGGQAAVAPTVLSSGGMAFDSWDADFSFVTEDLTVRALYANPDVFGDGTYSVVTNGYAWTFVIADGEATIVECGAAPVGHLDIPGVLGGCPVVALGASLFDNGVRPTPDFESVTIAASVVRIGDRAFYGCPALKYVTYAGDVDEIKFGEDVFAGTPYGNGWAEPVLEIENGEVVGYASVHGVHGCLTNGVMVIPGDVASVRAGALREMEGLVELVVPANVKSIGDFAFAGCSDLATVTFADREGCSVCETAFDGTPWKLARTLTFGPGLVSTFSMGDGVCAVATERAVIAGVAGATWSDFANVPYRGNGYDEVESCLCLTCGGITDVEKTEKVDFDDYACWELPKINMAYWGGYVAKGDYPTEDDVADAYRANGCRDEVFAWLNVPTNRLDEAKFEGAFEVNEFMVRHLKDGNALVELTTSISAHGITCCGYVCDESRELWEPGYLTGLFIVDSDNDMHVNGGGSGAPNRITYCPVRWIADGAFASYEIGNVWGLEWDAFRPRLALWAKDAPIEPQMPVPFDFEIHDATVAGFHGELPSHVVLPREVVSVGTSAFDSLVHNVGALTSIALPEGMADIGAYAFWGCESLTTVGIPASLKTISEGAFEFCPALTTIYVAPGDGDRIRELLAKSAPDIDFSKIAFVEAEHPELTAARLEWAKEDAIKAIEAAAGSPSGRNAALEALVRDAESAVLAATTPEAAEAAGNAGVSRIEDFLNMVECSLTGVIANFDMYESVQVGFRRITAVGSEVWTEVAADGTYVAELSTGDWQVTVQAVRKDGVSYTTTEALTITERTAAFDLTLPADEYLGSARVELTDAGQYANVGVGGLSTVAQRAATDEQKSVAYMLSVVDLEIEEEADKAPRWLMSAVPVASKSSSRAELLALREAALAANPGAERQVSILGLSLSRSEDEGDSWSSVDKLEDETVEVIIPLEFDEKADFTIMRSTGGEIDSIRQIVDNGLNPKETGGDEGFRVEPGKVVLQVSRFAVFAIVSGAPRGLLHPDGDGEFVVPAVAVSYEGVLLREGVFAGTLTATVSKPNVKKGSVADVSLKVKTLEKESCTFKAKKVALPGSAGVFALEPTNKKAEALGTATIAIGGDSLTGAFANGLEIDAVRDVFKAKGEPKRDRISRYVQGGRSWCIALATDDPGFGYAVLGAKVQTSGKVSVTGHMGDGIAVNASAKAEVGQGWIAVPFMVNKKSGGKTKTFGCRLSFDEASGKVGVANASDYSGATFLLAGAGLPELTKEEVKAATVSVEGGDSLPSHPDLVKLTYKETAGVIGGTVAWHDVAGKKKLTGKVYGVAVGRQGFGEVVVKGVGAFRFTLVLR